MIQINIEGNIVNVYKDDNESPIYQIRVAELPITMDSDGHNISQWVHQLMSKSWIEEIALYKLAAIIQKEFPKNNIDWLQTFFPVEKRLYLNHVKTTKYLTVEDKNQEVTSKSLSESLKIAMEEQNDFVNEEIIKIVKINLHHHNI